MTKLATVKFSLTDARDAAIAAQVAAQAGLDALEAAELEIPIEAPWTPWVRDISSELAVNLGPYTNASLNRDSGWWQRTLEQIDAVTIHHTLSHSPHASAAHYVQKTGGRPSLPYTIWITETGEVLLCVALTEGLWHDHTGHENTHLSIGLAGHLHTYRPNNVQLMALVQVCGWAIETLPGVTGVESIKGHCEYIATVCPGWLANPQPWRDRFFEMLGAT